MAKFTGQTLNVMPISTAEYIQMLARTSKIAPVKTGRAHAGQESDLHDLILDYCKGRGWIPIHSRMDRQTTTAVGVADFIILANNRTLVIECKRKGRKMTAQQQGFIVWARKLGHPATCVWSFDEFLEFVKQEQARNCDDERAITKR